MRVDQTSFHTQHILDSIVDCVFTTRIDIMIPLTIAIFIDMIIVVCIWFKINMVNGYP
jgi:hypothetical protein